MIDQTRESFPSVPDSPARIAPIDKAKITEDWVRAGGDGLGGGKTVPKPPKPPKTPKPSKVTEIKQATNKTAIALLKKRMRSVDFMVVAFS